MIHNDIQNQLALLVKTISPPLIEVASSPIETPQWIPGQRIPAHVIASLPNGRFHVMVQDQTLDMNLPRSTQAGDTLELVFVGDKPRATFALMSDLAKALPAGSQNVNLSQTGRFLGALIQQSTTTRGAPLQAAGSILQGAPGTIAQFATALRDAISQSGLFYESHQAQWVTGERSLESLLREPQAKLHSPAADSMPAQESGKQIAEKASATNQAVQSSASEMKASALTTAMRGNALEGAIAQQLLSSAPVSNQEPVHALATPIVQQQLGILDGRQIVWQGQIWPGQDMDWEIEEDGANQAYDSEEQKVWRTSLRLDFPVLGGLTANLALRGSGLKLDFFLEKETSANMIRAELPVLAQSIESSGMKIDALSVRQDGRL